MSTLLVTVVNKPQGAKVLQRAKALGATGGTLFYGEGTLKEGLLHHLGLTRQKKEILLLITSREKSEELMSGLDDTFHFARPHHGILFAMNLSSVRGTHHDFHSLPRERSTPLDYEAIFAIVNSPEGQRVVDAATAAGARGATIIHGRGSATKDSRQVAKCFGIEIVPEKEIVLFLVPREKTEDIIAAIEDQVALHLPGEGILFTMDVEHAIGLA